MLCRETYIKAGQEREACLLSLSPAVAWQFCTSEDGVSSGIMLLLIAGVSERTIYCDEIPLKLVLYQSISLWTSLVPVMSYIFHLRVANPSIVPVSSRFQYFYVSWLRGVYFISERPPVLGSCCVKLFGDNSSVNAFTAYERQFTVKGFSSMSMLLNSKVVCKALATVDVGWVFHRSYHPKS